MALVHMKQFVPMLDATVGGGGTGYSTCGYTEKDSWLSTCELKIAHNVDSNITTEANALHSILQLTWMYPSLICTVYSLEDRVNFA